MAHASEKISYANLSDVKRHRSFVVTPARATMTHPDSALGGFESSPAVSSARVNHPNNKAARILSGM
jgi:hypothetical protein